MFKIKTAKDKVVYFHKLLLLVTQIKMWNISIEHSVRISNNSDEFQLRSWTSSSFVREPLINVEFEFNYKRRRRNFTTSFVLLIITPNKLGLKLYDDEIVIYFRKKSAANNFKLYIY